MKALGIIPARGGSKGIPQKNLTRLGGKSLVGLTIECAHSSNALDRVIVSTDNEEISNTAKICGAEVPFIRPAKLAADDTPDFPVFLHAINWLKDNEDYEADFVVWLRPTSPFRSPDDISKAIRLLEETGADSVRSVCGVDHHPYWMKILGKEFKITSLLNGLDEKKYSRRQTLPDVFRLNGAVEVIRSKAAVTYNCLYGQDVRGYVMPPDRSLDIDTYEDLKYAEFLIYNK
jgi:CMP-N,N'-diacetyllegionaminic acid synthase